MPLKGGAGESPPPGPPAGRSVAGSRHASLASVHCRKLLRERRKANALAVQHAATLAEKQEEVDALKVENASRDVLLAKLQARLDSFEKHHKASSGNGSSGLDERIAPRPKTAEPRRPETFSDERSQDQAGEVHRFAF